MQSPVHPTYMYMHLLSAVPIYLFIRFAIFLYQDTHNFIITILYTMLLLLHCIFLIYNVILFYLFTNYGLTTQSGTMTAE